MSQLDGLKEELVYFRLWLGIAVVAEISLFGWIASASETTAPRLFSLAVGGIMVLGAMIYRLHRQIKRRIKQIRSL
jgi:drug/metabolite transporter superfamily protein YnfA